MPPPISRACDEATRTGARCMDFPSRLSGVQGSISGRLLPNYPGSFRKALLCVSGVSSVPMQLGGGRGQIDFAGVNPGVEMFSWKGGIRVGFA